MSAWLASKRLVVAHLSRISIPCLTKPCHKAPCGVLWSPMRVSGATNLRSL